MCRCGCCTAASGAVSGSVSGLQHHLGEVGLPHTVARVVWVSHAVDLQVAAAERRRLGRRPSPPSLRVVLHQEGRLPSATAAGAPPPAAVLEAMEGLGVEVTHVYGLTESHDLA